MIVSLSGIIIPLILFMILLYGMISKKEMYQPFLEGVQDGFKVVMEIAPTLIALFLAVQIFRTSGALDLLVSVLSPVGQLLKIPKDVLPVIFAKLFSSSAATGFLLDIFKNFGPDSAQGVMSSIILSSTETCFYTMSIYFSAVHPGRCSSGNLRRSNGQCISHRDALKTGAGKISSPPFLIVFCLIVIPEIFHDPYQKAFFLFV